MVDSRSRRVALGVALAAYGAFLALVLLAPTSTHQSAAVAEFAELGVRLGFPPELATPARAEFLANAAILAPVSALGSLLWRWTSWRDWVAVAFVLACSVELAQGVLLPQRSATMVDVVANTLGGLVGAVLVGLVRWVAGRRG